MLIQIYTLADQLHQLLTQLLTGTLERLAVVMVDLVILVYSLILLRAMVVMQVMVVKQVQAVTQEML